MALCVNCNVERKHYRVTGSTSYACHACGNHIYPLAGTIFHKSSTPLRTWFYVIRLMASTRVGVSAKQIQRETGVTYKTAWRMMKQVRKLMAEKITLKGPVEMDEAYFGGSDSNKRRQLLRGRSPKLPSSASSSAAAESLPESCPTSPKNPSCPSSAKSCHPTAL